MELPTNVTDQVPKTKQLLFVKLSDRIMLIDPDTKFATEIILESATIHAVEIEPVDQPEPPPVQINKAAINESSPGAGKLRPVNVRGPALV